VNVSVPRVLLLLLMPVLLAACSATQPRLEQPTSLSLAYSRLGAVQEGVVSSELELADLVSEFDSQDDVYGGWLATFELCRFHTHSGALLKAEPICDDALQRARLSGKHSAIFNTAIQIYIYRGDDRYLSLAQKFADSKQDRQVLDIAQGSFSDLSLPQDEHPQASIRAYQYYWFGKQHGDNEALQNAYQLFADTGNSRGQADVLFLRAQLAARSGDDALARDMASRAELVLRAIGEDSKAKHIREWADHELVAR